MKIQYISDIHLEFLKNIPKIEKIGDVLVLAGDIGYPFSNIYKDFLIDMNNKFNKIFLITGNHEFYNLKNQRNKTSEEISDHIINIIETNNLDHITYLDDSYEEYEGVRFCGTTLWSKIDNSNYLINDFTSIKDINIKLRNELFINSCIFIDEMINESKLPIIMITHHLPSFKLIHSDFLTDKYKNYNQCFASNCDQYFKDPIKIWIFGHTHKECEAEINNIKFLCNPVGYPDENNNQKTKIIEIYK